jgi:UDP-GlcNAc:undecaprenyl-phosphate GlcNAc-1-phosphate transferase
MLTELLSVFATCFISLLLTRRFAKIVGLVDKPNARKNHTGAVPLVGGISICVTLLFFILRKPEVIHHSSLYLTCIVALTLLGALDDKFDVSFKLRLLIQAALSLVMIQLAGLELHILGNMFGLGYIDLGSGLFSFSALVTILAVIGAINAFNMVDGIDGLLGGLSIVTFTSIAILLNIDHQTGPAYLCMVIVVAMLPYISMNLGLLGRERKVFMGDAGSMLIGFSVIWIMLSTSQSQVSGELLMRPVTALWLIALPLMDMAAIMIRRIRRGDSPFKPDREHLHHIFQRLGLSSRQTLLTICTFASLFAGFGIYGEITKIPEPVMFYLFIGLFGIYAMLLAYVWRLTSFLRRWRRGTSERQVTN